MSLELASHGVSVSYCAELVAGTRPTSGYTLIPSIKSIPDFNPAPNNLQTTDLSQTMFHTYISGLRDLGGSMAFTANHTQAFMDTWGDIVQEFEDNKTAGLATWFVVIVPGLTESFYFQGEPAPLGLSAIEVDSVLEIDAYVAPTDVAGWQTKPT